MRISDWSSDVCSSDLPISAQKAQPRTSKLLPIKQGLSNFLFSRAASRSVRALDNLLHVFGKNLRGLLRVGTGEQDKPTAQDHALFVGLGQFRAPVVGQLRSAARRVGKECDSKCRSQWSSYH